MFIALIYRYFHLTFYVIIILMIFRTVLILAVFMSYKNKLLLKKYQMATKRRTFGA